MNKRRLFMTLLMLSTSLGISAARPAQNGSSGGEKSSVPRANHILAIGFLRTLNTAELVDFQTYGVYASWEALLAHQARYLNDWLATYHPQQPNGRFGTSAEILPGWSLRLVVHADGLGYDARLQDLNDKECWYAAITDESGVIRQSKAIDCEIQ